MTDRAPSEVETVARAIRQHLPQHGLPHDGWVLRSERMARAALDAARGRSRDDTVTLTEALERIAGHPTVVRNPDGVDQAAATMQLIARGALARFGAARADRTDP